MQSKGTDIRFMWHFTLKDGYGILRVMEVIVYDGVVQGVYNSLGDVRENQREVFGVIIHQYKLILNLYESTVPISHVIVQLLFNCGSVDA